MEVKVPFKGIAELLREGRVVPFLGAGANFGARLADSEEKLPLGAELARHFATLAEYPSDDARERDDLIKVSSYYVDLFSRLNLRHNLHKIFARDFEPCAIHRYLASVERLPLVITTNYDDLLERAFKRAGREFDVVIHSTDRADVQASIAWWRHGASEPTFIPPIEFDGMRDGRTVIYKMHGSVDRLDEERGSYVITEDDYVEFLSRMTNNQNVMPPIMVEHLSDRHFLFLGYGLRDWNLRVVLKNLREIYERGSGEHKGRKQEIPFWAIQYKPSAFERGFWDRRNVRIFDLDINAFVEGLESAEARK